MTVSVSLKRSLFIAGVVLVMAGPVHADVLTSIGNSLNSSLNQSVRNAQNGVINGVQAGVPNASAVASGKAIATRQTLSANTLCSQVPAQLQSNYTRVCRSFDMNNPCSALPVSGIVPADKAQLLSLCNAQQSLTRMEGQAAARVMPSSGEISQQIQKQIGSFGNH